MEKQEAVYCTTLQLVDTFQIAYKWKIEVFTQGFFLTY